MAESKPQWPGAGDLVIATIEAVMDYGAYAELDENGKRGLLFISEISYFWIPNIRVRAATLATQGGQGSFRREN